MNVVCPQGRLPNEPLADLGSFRYIGIVVVRRGNLPNIAGLSPKVPRRCGETLVLCHHLILGSVW